MKKELVDELVKGASQYGLCDDFRQRMEANPSNEEWANIYKRGFDFVLEHRFPSLEFMEKNVKGKFRKHDLFVSEKFNAKNPNELIALGRSEGKVECDNYCFSTVRLLNTTKATISVTNHSTAIVVMYDDCELSVVKVDETSDIKIIHKGGVLIDNGNKVNYRERVFK